MLSGWRRFHKGKATKNSCANWVRKKPKSLCATKYVDRDGRGAGVFFSPPRRPDARARARRRTPLDACKVTCETCLSAARARVFGPDG